MREGGEHSPASGATTNTETEKGKLFKRGFLHHSRTVVVFQKNLILDIVCSDRLPHGGHAGEKKRRVIGGSPDRCVPDSVADLNHPGPLSQCASVPCCACDPGRRGGEAPLSARRVWSELWVATTHPIVDSAASSQLVMPISIHRNPDPVRIAERDRLGLPKW